MRARLLQGLREAWAFLRQLSGDSAYDACAERARRRGQPVPSRQQHYLDRLQRRYAGISRCC